ncbi:MAG TPA: methionyl-tRNA formyltransferase [Methylomirabilota bacterium]|nr:methionyl-tRNA formyltransferase [Methylomirabilota bacterium]
MVALRIIFMGTAELSCASLERLAGGKFFSVAAVVTQPNKPKGRELKPQPSPVKILAQKLNLPILQPAKARDEKFISELRELQPDLIVVVAYGQILSPAILDLPKFGCVNVHTSLLPKYRGASPIQSAILNGETETGVTIMKMDAGLDTGDILAQARTPILPEDNSQTLHDRLAQLGAELLAKIIPNFVAGTIFPQLQPKEGATYAAKIKKEDGKIDWNLSAQEILNRLRAFTPWPGVFTFLPDSVGRASSRAETETSELLAGTLAPPKQLLKVWKAEMVECSGNAGEILSADKNGIVVACGKNALRILELQLEGGRRMNAREFLAGHSIAGRSFMKFAG